MSSEYNGNILYVKDENGEWIPIPSIVGPKGEDGKDGVDGQPGPAGPQGPQGEPGTTHWSDLEDKPFESIGEGLSVDSEGVLSAEGGLEIIYTITSLSEPAPTQELIDKMNVGVGVIVDIPNYGDRNGLYICNLINDVQYHFVQITTPIANGEGRVSTGTVSVYKSHPTWQLATMALGYVWPDTYGLSSGLVLTTTGDGNYPVEWAEPQSTTYTAGTGIDITNGVISCTFVDANSEDY